MSGGQQNKDEEVVKMVARMNELKEKQDICPAYTMALQEKKSLPTGSWKHQEREGRPEGFQEEPWPKKMKP